MKKRCMALVLIATLVGLLLTGLTASASNEIVIQDDALERFIRREIDKPQGPILPEDVEGLRTIDTTT